MKPERHLPALLLASSLALTACTAPDAKPKVAPLAATAVGLGAAPAPAVSESWWKALGDSQLDRIVGDALADHVGLSASHIQNIFKAATGSSISAYLRRLRLNKATEFLAQTDVPISEIAERTGFGNSNYFYTVFKRHYAVTPSEYRANRLNRADTKEAYNNEIN